MALIKHKKRFLFTTLILTLAFLGLALFSYNFGFYLGEKSVLQTAPTNIANEDLNQPQVDFSIFWEAWRQLERNYLEKEDLDYQAMVYGAISGMVQSLGDPHTNFFTPQEAADFQDQLSGEYQGVGMIVGLKDNQLTIVSPFKGSPAETAGLKSGDKIIEINGVYTTNLSIDEAVNLIKGEEGTTVTLLIQRNGWSQARAIEVARAVIEIPTLEWEMREDKIAVIKIYHFNDILNREFKEAAFEILKSEADSIILDVRNNPGGYLEVAQDITGWFLEKDLVIVWEEKGEGEREAYRSKGPASFKSFPTVVLINEGSASASEILAGALRDQRDIQLIGQTSFGKGSVQKPVIISDNSYLKVTVAKWLTPDGISISEQGLEPDIIVEDQLADDGETVLEDQQMEKAIEIIKSLR